MLRFLQNPLKLLPSVFHNNYFPHSTVVSATTEVSRTACFVCEYIWWSVLSPPRLFFIICFYLCIYRRLPTFQPNGILRAKNNLVTIFVFVTEKNGKIEGPPHVSRQKNQQNYVSEFRKFEWLCLQNTVMWKLFHSKC